MTTEVVGDSETHVRVEFSEFELASLEDILDERWVYNENFGALQLSCDDGLWEIVLTRGRPGQSNNDSICIQRDSLIRLELSGIDHVNIDKVHNEVHFIPRVPEGEFLGNLPLYRIFNGGFKHQVTSEIDGSKIRAQCPIPEPKQD